MWLGQTDYVSAMQLQDRLLNRGPLLNLYTSSSHELPAETLLGLEHPLTITLGRRADALKDIKAPIRELKDRAVAILGSERGGQATLHNPGQLVIYPVIQLRERQLKVRDYVRILQDVTQRFLADRGVKSRCLSDQEPGLYTDEGKVVFFGIRVKNGMSSHGLAINVNNNLEDFKLIRSCGRATETFSRMADYGETMPLEDLFRLWSGYFQTALNLTQDANRPILSSPDRFCD